VIIDCLSIISIHAAIDKTTSQTKESFTSKLLKMNLFNYILLLVSYQSIEIKEYAIKFYSMLLGISKEFCEKVEQNNGHEVLLNCLVQSLQEDSVRSGSYQLCHTILEAMVCKFDNSNDLCPTNSSLVHQIFNNSRVAEEIV